ncbi:hypothetical protein A0J61_09466 [Choanephora cucurbitarum]|uniref:GATA-type domain-containing protein n=2 Tax=Choanephora cucurbitarum TaxID=101091 RepID=A0A1C7N575_9FUNG|nr:hypothetical protein A0J61_09466 [Choanephora cucurbitarum]
METSLLPQPKKINAQCQNHLIPGNQDNWEVLDIVLYTITDNVLLAFFHSAEPTSQCRLKNSLLASGVTCDASVQKTFTQQDGESLRNILNSTHQSYSTHLAQTPLRIFTIAGQTQNAPLIFHWSSLNPDDTSMLEEARRISKTLHAREYKSTSFKAEGPQPWKTILNTETNCSRHSHTSDTVQFLFTNCSFERISIPYGDVVFESYQIIPLFTHSSHRNSLCRPQPSLMITESISSRSTSPLGTVVELPSPLLLLDHHEKNSTCYVAGTTEINDPHTRQTTHDPIQSNKPMSALFQKFRVYSNPPVHLIPQDADSKRYPIDKRDRFFNRKYGCPIGDGLVPNSTKICVRCHTSNSPEWRRGPDGNKTLCNACGLRYSRLKSKQWKLMDHFNKL